MAEYLIQDTSLTAIANAIRTKTGKTATITLDDMPSEINSLSVSEAIAHADIPDYVKSAAQQLAEKIRAVQTDNTITFLAMADSHHCGEQDDTSWQDNINISNLHAGMAAKVLSYILNMDFVCHLGDVSFGGDTTTSEWLHQQIDEMGGWLDESQKGIPTFWSVGNHDTGMYSVNAGTETELESADYLFDVFGARCDGATYGSTEYGYCYRDFTEKKIRVICLNTSELDTVGGYGTNPSMSDTQLLWFAQTLYDVGSKTNASQWSVVVLSHYPLDFTTSYASSHVVKAYVEGSSVTFNGTTVNFSGVNGAKFVANFHGHTHCFKYAKLNQVDATALTASEYEAWRIGVPNSCFYRNNHQSTSGDKHGIIFAEDVTYDKIIGSDKDTAFVVNVIDPINEVVHSFCYGAGYDRAIGYGEVTWYTITKSLSNVTISNTSGGIEENEQFIAMLLPDVHCAISSIIITMGGIDITSSVYSDGVINIPEVTNNVVISVKARLNLACINQIPISTDTSGNIYNDIGYKSGYAIHYGEDYRLDGCCATGFIPIENDDILRMQNINFMTGDDFHRICFYDSSKNFIGHMSGNSPYLMNTTLQGVKDENGNYTQFTINTTHANSKDAAYIRISASNITDKSVVTLNEEIIYVDDIEDNIYTITNTLTNATTDNNITSVNGGVSYSANITVSSEYELKNITVTMDGVNVTSSVYANGVIFIPCVTGNVVITVIAELPPSYTNQLAISTDASGNVYNGKGFKEDTYLSSGNEGTRTGIYTTGFIPCKIGDILYCKNVGMQTGQDGHRLCFYNADKSFAKTLIKTTNTGYTGFTYGDDGNIRSIRINVSGSNQNTAFVRFCCSYLGEDSIVTVNEPIE